MHNNSSQSKFTKVTVRVLMALLAVCLLLSAAPFVAPDALPSAKAAAVLYQVPAGTGVAAINSNLSSYPAGSEVNVLLQGNVDFTSQNPDGNKETFGIIIPAGITVNLYMGGNSIVYSRIDKAQNALWQQKGIFAIVNNGDLNIYSGNPSTPNLAAGEAVISVVNQRTGMSISDDERAYSRVDAIVNGGNLTVNKAVKIQVTNYLGYKDQNAERGATTVATTGIYNTSNTATCKVNSATIDILAQAYAITERTSNDVEHGRAFAYGIYGGDVDISGASVLHTNAYARMACANAGISNKQNGCLITVAYDVCSGGDINITGGEFTYETSHACNQAVTDKGTSWSYSGAVCYSGAAPMIADATITSPTTAAGVRGNNKIYREATVTKAPVLPYSGYALFHSDSTPGTSYNGVWDTYNEPSYPVNDVQAGSYTDETGNTYSCALDTTDDTNHPSTIDHGAADGLFRVRIVYRYWTTSTKDVLDTSIVGAEGYAGYSFDPIGDGTNIVASPVKLNGLADATTLRKAVASAISYKSGGETINDNYWKLHSITYRQASGWFSDFDVDAYPGTTFKSFTGTTDNSVAAGVMAPIYIFVDYYKAEPTGIKASAGTGNKATVTYTGEAIKASDAGLTISKATGSATDYTSEYNIDFTNNALIPVTYSWTGTNTAGVSESGTGALPTNAGTYSVTLSIADDTVYNSNDCDPSIHKNRRALEYTFTLEIEQAYAKASTLPSNVVTYTYGNTLNDVIDLAGASVTGIKGENLSGSFSFTNAQDGYDYKNVNKNIDFATVSVTWIPSYPAGTTVKNYKTTAFTVKYKVNPAPLQIAPTAAAVVYGETEFTTPFGISVTGLVGNDYNSADAKAAIANAINYMILVNGSYVAYDPENVGAGSYKIRARVDTANIPAVLSNYEYTYADMEAGADVAELAVAKRGLTVQASAVSRGYAVDNYDVNVTYTITAGKFGVDDVRVSTGTGALADNSAGTREVSGVSKAAVLALLTGGKSANYTISELVYDTGATLTVEITKAVPTVNTPVVADIFYRRTQKLADITLAAASSSVPGSWQWADPQTVPSVNTSVYPAKFVPDDSVNYETKYADITLVVKPSAVTVSYAGTVEYGDPVPNITAYTYTSVQDPDFDIKFVTTNGNITPTTTYTQGSPVNADGYPVTITAPNYKDAAGNYTFTPANGKITVVPRNIEFTVENVTVTYGDNFTATASTVNLTYDETRFVGSDSLTSITANGTEPVFSYTTTFRYQDNYAVGNYEIKATPSFSTSPNYTVSVKNGTLTVNKAPLTIKANDITLAYNSEVPSNLSTAYMFVGAKRNEGLAAIVTDGAIKVDTNYEKGSPVNTEGYPVIIDVSEASFRNYSVTVENGKISVIKADPEITEYPEASVIYGQSLADAVFTGGTVSGSVPGTYAYNSASTVPAYSTDPYTIYTATFIPDDTANYNTVPGLYIALTVRKMPVSGALAVAGIPMKGETLTVDVSGLSPDEIGVYTFSWTMDGAEIGTGTSFVLTDANVGKVIKVTANAQGYYEGSVSYTTTEIAPELTSVADIIKADTYSQYLELTGLDNFGTTSTFVYDANGHAVTLTQKSTTFSSVVLGTITVKYNGSTDIPKNAGLYNVTIDVATPDLSRVNEAGVTTYSPASNLSIGTLEITKAPYNVTVTIGDKVYDGYNTASASDIQENGAVVLAGGVKDAVSYDASKAVYTFADANVGSDKAVTVGTTALAGSAAENYELNVQLANGGKADITPRTLKVEAEAISREYQEDYYDVDLAFRVDVNTIAPADTMSYVYVDEAKASGRADDYHAGTRRVTVSGAQLAGSKAANYVLEITNINTLTVLIERATPSYPIPYTGIVYYDSGRTLSNISLGDSRWAWDSAVANEIPGAGTHTYTAVYTPDDTANYAAVNYEVMLEIRKTPVTVKSASFNVIYGEDEPTYYYTVSGLTGADTKNDLGGYIIQNCSYTPGADVGEYSVVLSGGFTSSNYTFTYIPGTVTVSARPVYVTAEAVSREYEEGNVNVTVSFSALSNVYAGDSSNVYLQKTSVTGTVASDTAGIKPVSFEVPALAGSKAANYELSILNPDLKAEIAKAHIAGIILPTTGKITYGQRLADTQFTSGYNGTEYGTFSMENPMSTPAAVGTFADVYKVVFTPENSINYAAETAYISLTVSPATLTVDMTVYGNCEVKKTVSVACGALPDDAPAYINYKWYRVDSYGDSASTGVLIASGVSDYVLTDKDAGKYILVVAENISGSPYIVSGSAYSDVSVSQQKLSFWQKLVNWFYHVIASITQLFGRL